MKILLSLNKKILQKYIPQHSKFGFVPTASEFDNNRWYMEEDRSDLIKMNYDIIDIEVSKESREEILQKLNNIDAIFVAGGNTFYLLQELKNKDILQDLIKFANNKIYVGTSAGACIACPNIEYIEKLDDKSQAPLLDNCNALNLVDFYVLPHYKSKEKYTKIADEIEKNYINYKFIKLSDEHAIIVDNSGKYSIIETQ